MADAFENCLARPGQAIGILGGGQLARMMAMAAAELGLRTIIFAPAEEAGPAAEIAWRHIDAAYTDEKALAALADEAAVVTYEFENVPAIAASTLEKSVPVFPSARALQVSQDRLLEKQFLSSLNIPLAPFAEISCAEDLDKAAATVGFPAVLKTRLGGYDGKGQAKVTNAEELRTAWQAIHPTPTCLEGFVAFEGEASIVAARGHDGTFAAYDLSENVHKNHILDTSTVPARWNGEHAEQGRIIAQKIAEALDYVGVFAVEFFVTKNGLIANEIAPRVHNSGHWTQDAAQTSQFEQHIRAVCGWPLGNPARHSDAVMTNLVGADVETWPDWIAKPNTHLHLYGKHETRRSRKMGHVTTTFALGKLNQG